MEKLMYMHQKFIKTLRDNLSQLAIQAFAKANILLKNKKPLHFHAEDFFYF